MPSEFTNFWPKYKSGPLVLMISNISPSKDISNTEGLSNKYSLSLETTRHLPHQFDHSLVFRNVSLPQNTMTAIKS